MSNTMINHCVFTSNGYSAKTQVLIIKSLISANVLKIWMLYIDSKQLRSCQDSQLLNNTVPGQASLRQFTSIKCSFFRQ